MPTSDQRNLAAVQVQQSKPRIKSADTEIAAANLKKLQAQLKDAEDAARAAITRRDAIVGRTVIAAMQHDETLRNRVVDALEKQVTGKAERIEISMLINAERNNHAARS